MIADLTQLISDLNKTLKPYGLVVTRTPPEPLPNAGSNDQPPIRDYAPEPSEPPETPAQKLARLMKKRIG